MGPVVERISRKVRGLEVVCRMKISELVERNARRNPGREALVQDDVRLTYAQLAERVMHIASCLANLGVEKGDRILVQMGNLIPYVELYFAAPLLGAILVPLNVRLAPAEMPYFIEHSKACCLVADLGIAEKLTAQISDWGAVQERVVVGGDLEGWRQYHLLQGRDDWKPPPYDRCAENDVAYIFYTSGTTGRPKGAMWSNRQVCEHLITLQLDLPLKQDDCSIVAVNLSHGASTLPTLHQTFFVGGRVELYPGPKFIPEEFADKCMVGNATTTLLVPTMLSRMLRLGGNKGAWFKKFKYIKYVAAKMLSDDLNRAVQLLGMRLTQGYGSTETVGGVTCLSPWDHDPNRPGLEQRLSSSGKEYCNVRVAIMGEDGRLLSAGEIGEIVVRADKTFEGYWRDPAATARAYREGWLLTGDLGRLDEEGYLYVVDRISDMIITGGENVYPREVEDVLADMQGILECAIVGVPDPEWGEAVWAFVVPVPDFEVNTSVWADLCSQRLAGYKRPKHWQLCNELPKNHMGKVQKTLLRENALKFLEDEER
ncbi:putative Long-chain-fatty-acid--CoA ligase FadD13 [uncultured Desulfatiglans sp.]|nr:putative Long-chain-fatty-acid--CoA ligase FadD13 [uncultured Desulfatiglans sp.]